MTPDQEAEFAPDLLITFGGAIVSKRIKAYLRKYTPQIHWKVTETTFLKQLLDVKSDRIPSNFGGKWKQRDFIAQSKATAFLEHTPYSDLKVMELMLDCIPEQAHIHMGNSSIVRYCQLFDPIASMTYFSNRGTSGIDGSTSTAVGAALAKQDVLHVLLTGDVSFFYDSNALWNNYAIPNLRIILINNGGGGIFNIIKGPRGSRQNARKGLETKNQIVIKIKNMLSKPLKISEGENASHKNGRYKPAMILAGTAFINPIKEV
ncbi:hypothetical protein ANCCEY_15219 [Ancylostoma ceylanicum]|uniref:Thiamine pyrophosphate enzyme TPP-binding domain-containing protein n=1 Tax=Ancylostoma ceylanicum TaxID=53326 RepID=A0A0D6L3W7_9BILA|nr:hypothetical protein ANCCEY_15219 [Ancylostoma ceylanicum]